MKIKGVVCENRHQRYTVRTKAGYTVVDVVDGELQEHDTVTGHLEDHGQVFLTNHTSEEIVEVDVLAFHASPAAASALLHGR